MLTDRFKYIRKQTLSDLLNIDKVVSIWSSIVWKQLRDMDIKDMFDYYDINYNIRDRVKAIRNEILEGNYKASQPMIYKLEKKYGICRHIIIPQPIDALVLQVIVEKTADNVLSKQPSANTFFSRDRHNVYKPHNLVEDGYTLRSLWKKLQKQIYKFVDEKDCIIITDLSNYYDSIDILELRNSFAKYSQEKEEIIDLLFNIIVSISWTPDYLPYKYQGLPVTNIEGIRLLAHSFLFEMDDIIVKKSNNCYTRWMDDVIIGADSKKEAISIISSVSDILKSRGLALNFAKTQIIDESEAIEHFQIKQNKFIDSIESLDLSLCNVKELQKEVYNKFKTHLQKRGAKYWDKIAKRYITLHKFLNSTKIIPLLPNLYIQEPSLRVNLIYYFAAMGYSKLLAKKILDILDNLDSYDDLSLFQLCRLVTDWEVPINDFTKTFLLEFETKIESISKTRKEYMDFYSVLWFKAKYNGPFELLKFVKDFQNIWQRHSFIRRQVTATLARLLLLDDAKNILNNQVSSGILNTVSLAIQICEFSETKNIDSRLGLYLFNKNQRRPYGLSKFLVLCSVLNAKPIRESQDVVNKIRMFVKDPYYLQWIQLQYSIKL